MRKMVGLGMCLAIFILGYLIFSGAAGCSTTSHEKVSGEIAGRGKSSAPVSISYTLPAKAVVDEPLEVTVEFSTHSDAEELTLTLAAGKGLELLPAEYQIDYGTQPRNSAFSETITVTPQNEGILYLNVFVAGKFNGNKMVRTGAVPVKVGSGNRTRSLKKPGRVTGDAEGQKIIIMPAQE